MTARRRRFCEPRYTAAVALRSVKNSGTTPRIGRRRGVADLQHRLRGLGRTPSPAPLPRGSSSSVSCCSSSRSHVSCSSSSSRSSSSRSRLLFEVGVLPRRAGSAVCVDVVHLLSFGAVQSVGDFDGEPCAPPRRAEVVAAGSVSGSVRVSRFGPARRRRSHLRVAEPPSREPSPPGRSRRQGALGHAPLRVALQRTCRRL